MAKIKIFKKTARPVAENNGQKNNKKTSLPTTLPTTCGMGEVKKIFGDMEVAKSLPPCGRWIARKEEAFQVDRKRTWKDDRSAADAVRSGFDKVVNHLIEHRVILCPRCRKVIFKGAGVRTLSLAMLEAWRKKAREREARELREKIKELASQARGQLLGDLLRETGIAPAADDEPQDRTPTSSLPTPTDGVGASPRKGKKNKKSFPKDGEGDPDERRGRSPKAPEGPKGNKGNLRKAILG